MGDAQAVSEARASHVISIRQRIKSDLGASGPPHFCTNMRAPARRSACQTGPRHTGGRRPLLKRSSKFNVGYADMVSASWLTMRVHGGACGSREQQRFER